MKRRAWLDVVAVVLVVAAICVLAVLRDAAERRAQIPPDSYASSDYLPGGFHAWRTLLEREGFAVESFDLRPGLLDRSIDTLIVAVPHAELGTWTDADQFALLRWVRDDGGHLVLLDYGSGNDAMGLFSSPSKPKPKAKPKKGGAAPRPAPTAKPVAGALRGPYASDVHTLAPRGDDRYLPETAQERREVRLGDGLGALAIVMSRGKGTIVLVTETDPFTNRALARADNARLAYLIARPARPGGTIAFDDALHGALVERPWWQALPRPVDAALGVGAVAFVLWLLLSLVRNGRALPPPAPREPTSAEFLAALAALYARTQARHYAADVLDAAAFATAARALGLPPGANPQVLVARAAQRRGDDVARLIAARATEPRTDRELIVRAHTAYTVRKDFSYGQGDRSRAAFDGGTRTRRRG
jgi:hypothetical protein